MSKLRSIIKRITKPFLNTWLKFYYRKPRKYSYQGIEVLVHPEVFPPQLTLSTKILLDFISEIDLENKTFLELGCGCGIISLFARKKGAFVTASDINKTALDYLDKASKENQLEVSCVYSNLFEKLKNKNFDFIIINPPYYPKQAKNIKEQAWFCGEEFQYFENLFIQLPQYLSTRVSLKALADSRRQKPMASVGAQGNQTYMILSEDCNFERINSIATKNNQKLDPVFKIKKMGELNVIYSITQIDM